MIEYMLENDKGQRFGLNTHTGHVAFEDTWTQGEDSFKIESKVAERSFLPGSALVGDIRTKAREIELTFEYVHKNSEEYRKYMNKLLMWFYDTKYLIDDTHKMRLEVVPQGVDVEYNDGSLKHHSENTFKFLALHPYWEASNISSVHFGATYEKSASGSEVYTPAPVNTPLEINVKGSAPVLPKIIIRNQNKFKWLRLYFQTSSESFHFLVDKDYPSNVEIDCAKGVLWLDGQRKNEAIREGSGFFMIQPSRDEPDGNEPHVNELVLTYLPEITDSSAVQNDLMIFVTWRDRFWL